MPLITDIKIPRTGKCNVTGECKQIMVGQRTDKQTLPNVLSLYFAVEKGKIKPDFTNQILSVYTKCKFVNELSKLLSPEQLYGCHLKSCHSCQRLQQKIYNFLAEAFLLGLLKRAPSL